MGNKNVHGDKEFMEAYRSLSHEFIKAEEILFDAEEIQFPLSTSGMKIVDARGKRVKLAGANWSGGHMERHCVSGLEYRPLR